MKSLFKTEQNKVRWDLILVFGIILIVGLLTFFKVFEKLDYRVYDELLSLKPATEERNDVVMVAIDNQSIAELGSFPWPRDIIADSIIRMRELGASSVVFDIEYLSPSALGVDTNASEALPDTFNAVTENLVLSVQELSDAVSSGQLPVEYFPDMANSLNYDYIIPEISSLYENVSNNIFRDNDEYFAKALHYFGNSWLTLNITDMDINPSEELLKMVEERILYNNVSDPEYLISKECDAYYARQGLLKGFTASLEVLLEQATGAGFTNVVLDSDGVRRRIKLFFNKGDQYAGQLVFAPILNILKPSHIIRDGSKLIIEDATFPGSTEKETFSIPLDKDGNMLINWIKKDFNHSFHNEPVLFLHELDATEKNIISILKDIESFRLRGEDGYMLPYYDVVVYLLDQYENCKLQKEVLLNDLSVDSRTDPRYDQLFADRKQFFKDCEELLDPYYINGINDLLPVALANDPESLEYYTGWVEEIFAAFGSNLNLYNEYFSDMESVYKDAFCIVGHTASASTDLGTTPFENNYANIGTHANVYNTIMTKSFITPISTWIGFGVASLLLFFIILLVGNKKAAVFNLLNILGILFIVLAGVLPMIFYNYYIEIISPVVIMVLGYIGTTILRFLSSEKDKTFLRRAFSTFLSEDVVDILVKDPNLLKLGGEERNVTAIFTDIKGFSTFSEKVTPTQLVSFLNKYLTLLSDIILENRGTIDKYEGDAIIAFFGAPISSNEHAWQACISAVRMKQAEKEFNKEMLAAGLIPSEINTRIGINTGNMVVGNMGTEQKMNYTMMGNNVNLAARLEGVNKFYKSWILVSEATWNEANSGEHEGILLARRLDKVRVVGINTPVQLYNIIGVKDELPKETLESIEVFHQALDLYLKKDFINAGKLFLTAQKLYTEDETPSIFIDRCKQFYKNGVPEDWDGVINMTSK